MNFKPPTYFMEAMAPIVGQFDLKRKLAAAFTHYTLFLDDSSVGRPTVLVYGPSGSGKTFGVELCCQASGLPYSVIGGAGVSSAGYKGVTLRDLLAQHYLLYRKSEGIVFVDEVDKWTRGGMKSSDSEQIAMGTSRMAELLRYVEREDVYFQDEGKDLSALREEDPEDPENQDPDAWLPVRFETRRAMWVLAGAFDGLHHIIKQRHQQDTLVEESHLWEKAGPEDFRRYGMLPELVNRCEVAAWVKPLKGEQLIEIIEAQEAPKLRTMFQAVGCALELDGGAVAQAAHLAVQEKTGARGAVLRLRHVVYDCLTEASERGLSRCRIDAQVMTTGHLPLEPLSSTETADTRSDLVLHVPPPSAAVEAV